MTQTTPVSEMRALAATAMRLIAGEKEPDPNQDTDDPTLQLLLRYKIRPDSRLRTLYQAARNAAADKERIAGKIDRAMMELQRIQATHLARWDNPSIDTELPSTDEALQYEGAKGRAELIRHCVDAWRHQVEGYELKAGDAGREWEGTFEHWRNLIFTLYGDEQCAPPWRTKAWEAPQGMEKVQLEQTRAALEQ
jgi:hypothetical protein